VYPPNGYGETESYWQDLAYLDNSLSQESTEINDEAIRMRCKYDDIEDLLWVLEI
jgi:hypothetical protein